MTHLSRPHGGAVFGDAQTSLSDGSSLQSMTHTPHGLWPPPDSRRSAARLCMIAPAQLPAAWLRQYQFCLMREGLRHRGGLLTLRQLRLRMGGGVEPHQLSAKGVLLTFPWLGEQWFPGFQFDTTHRCLRADLVPIYAELPGSYDAWDTVHWFAAPNAFLRGARPVALLQQDRQAAVAAARAEHFVVNG